MNKYVVEVKEILSRKIVVNAETEEKAKEIIEKKYRDEEIILDSTDYVDTEIEVVK